MNKRNFFLKTFAFYKGCKRPKRKPDYVSVNQYGDISSEYWYTDKGVIRCSNHWSNILASSKLKAFTCGKVASCIWVLKNHSKSKGYSDIPCGFCRWENFRFIQ